MECATTYFRFVFCLVPSKQIVSILPRIYAQLSSIYNLSDRLNTHLYDYKSILNANYYQS